MLHAAPRTVDAGLPVRYGPTGLGPGGLERCGTDTTALVCPLSVGTAGAPRSSRTTHPLGRAGRALRRPPGCGLPHSVCESGPAGAHQGPERSSAGEPRRTWAQTALRARVLSRCRGMGLALGVIALPGGRWRDEPQGVVRAPGPEGGPAAVRPGGAFAAPPAACGETEREASPVTARCAGGVLVPRAQGRQERPDGAMAIRIG